MSARYNVALVVDAREILLFKSHLALDSLKVNNALIFIKQKLMECLFDLKYYSSFFNLSNILPHHLANM